MTAGLTPGSSTRTTYTQARANLARLCDRVAESRESYIIERRNGENVALISEAELSAVLETAHLLRLRATLRDPFRGIGKPEPLRFHLHGCGSRRVTEEHRLVHLVRRDRIDFLQARYHY